jgi:hypothetical protein
MISFAVKIILLAGAMNIISGVRDAISNLWHYFYIYNNGFSVEM